MLLPTLVRWLSRWVSYLLFSIISKIPKTKVDIVPGTCTGHEAVSPLGGAESGHPGQHPGSQSWVVYLYSLCLFIPLTVAISQIYSIAAGPQSPGRAVTGATVRLCPLLPPPAAAALPLPDFSIIIGGIIEELHNILDTQKYISNKHISKC